MSLSIISIIEDLQPNFTNTGPWRLLQSKIKDTYLLYKGAVYTGHDFQCKPPIYEDMQKAIDVFNKENGLL